MKKKAYSVLNVVSAIAITAVAVSVVAAGSKIIGKADNIADQWKAQTATQSSSQTSQPAYDCSGGTIDSTSASGYIVHLFTEVGTNFQFSCTSNKSVEYLVVGGGGGSDGIAWHGGGGGGGGRTGNINIASGSNYIIAVGDGGAAGSSGESSSITFNQTIIAQANGGYANIGSMGGDSGNGTSGGDTDGDGESGGGGAGCDGNGGNANGYTPGSGGAGILYSITGTMVEYCIGGSGATSGVTPQPSPANSGWGAQGGGASGGSGIVVIRYSST